MFSKIALVILVTLISAACLLGMRQHRLAMAHDITQTLRDMDRSRQNLWHLQGKIASHTHPNTVSQQVESSGLHVEPLASPPHSPPTFPHTSPHATNAPQQFVRSDHD